MVTRRRFSSPTGEIIINYTGFDTVNYCAFCREKIKGRKGFLATNGTGAAICFECIWTMNSHTTNKNQL